MASALADRVRLPLTLRAEEEPDKGDGNRGFRVKLQALYALAHIFNVRTISPWAVELFVNGTPLGLDAPAILARLPLAPLFTVTRHLFVLIDGTPFKIATERARRGLLPDLGRAVAQWSFVEAQTVGDALELTFHLKSVEAGSCVFLPPCGAGSAVVVPETATLSDAWPTWSKRVHDVAGSVVPLSTALQVRAHMATPLCDLVKAGVAVMADGVVYIPIAARLSKEMPSRAADAIAAREEAAKAKPTALEMLRDMPDLPPGAARALAQLDYHAREDKTRAAFAATGCPFLAALLRGKRQDAPLWFVVPTGVLLVVPPALLDMTVQIFVSTLTGKTLTTHVSLTADTVLDLKNKITDIHGVPRYQQRLIFGGEQLDDSRHLASYALHAGSTVHLVLRLRGGGSCAAPTMQTADITETEGLKRKLSSMADAWRRLGAGVTLGAVCTTRDCEARGHEVLWTPELTESVFILTPDTRVPCPCCRHELPHNGAIYMFSCHYAVISTDAEGHVSTSAWKTVASGARSWSMDDGESEVGTFREIAFHIVWQGASRGATDAPCNPCVGCGLVDGKAHDACIEQLATLFPRLAL